MGGSSTKGPMERCSQDDTCSGFDMVDKQLKITQDEVSQQKPLITQNVIQQLELKEDSMVLRYGQLTNVQDIAENIRKMFKDDNAIQFLTDAATKMAMVYQNTDMKELLRWNKIKKVVKCRDTTVGMELHYKVVIVRERVGTLARVGGGSTDTVVILGYKFIQYALDVNPETLPKHEELKALRF